MTIRVRSGEMDELVEVDVFREAFRRALDRAKPKTLGLLVSMEVQPADHLDPCRPNEELFFSTVTLLKRENRWGGERETPHWGGERETPHWGGERETPHWGGERETHHDRPRVPDR